MIRFLLFSVLLCSFLEASSLEKVKLQLQWKYQFQFAGFIMAKELGYYKENGLDVEILEYNNTNSIKDLEDGKIDFAINNSLLAYHDTKLNKVTLLATYFQRSPLIIIAQPQIKSALDLKDKTIMMSENNLYNSSLSIMLEYFGINTTNANFIPPSFNLDDFINKKVDAFTGFRSNELFELNRRGIKYTIIDPVEYGFSTNAINLFASHNKIKNNPEQIKNFLEATKKGWIYALDHIEEVAKLIHEKYQPNKSLENLIYEGQITKELMLLDLYEIGAINHNFVLKTFEQLKHAKKIDASESSEYIMLQQKKENDLKDLFFMIVQKLLHSINITVAIVLLLVILGLLWLRRYWLDRLQVEIDKQNLIQERFTYAVEGSNDGLWDWNIKTNEVYYSPRWKEIIGYKDHEIKNSFEEWESLVHPDDLEKSHQLISELINNKDKELRFNIKFRMLHKDGHYVPILSRAKKIYNEKDELIRLVGTHVDLTKIVAMEDAYRRERDKSQLYLDTAEVLLVAFDTKANITMLNRKGEEILGFKEEEIVGKNWLRLDILSDEMKEYLEGFFKNGASLSELSHKTMEYSVFNKNKEEIILNIRTSLLCDDDKNIIGVLCSGVDITKQISTEKELQKQTEQLYRSEKMIAMGEMIGNIAHQWRQPLTVISSLASAISFKQEYNRLDTNELIPFMDQIVEQTNYLSSTIDDFRNFIKGDSAENLINMVSLFDKTLSITAPSLHNNYIEVISQIDPKANAVIHENELMQALINIINNSKDVLIENDTIEDKYIFIEVGNTQDHCEIKIKDNGGGIKSSAINRIFEPYFTTKHQSQGTGLGLSMTHKIITELHHGTITASNVTFTYKNKEYTGACFTILI